MANKATSTTARTTTTARKAATTATTATTAPAATTAPHGAVTVAVVGTPAGQVPHLASLASLPVPVALVAPLAPWPGWGRGVRISGAGWAGTAYANRGNVDLRVPVNVAAALAAQVPGATVRGAAGNYVRVPFTATGTPQA